METGKCAICQAGVEGESVLGAGEWVRWDKNVCVVFWSRLVNGEEKAKEEFEKRVKDAKKKAIEENIKNAQKSGNKLTQTLDEEGNLVGVKETVDFESREATTEEETKAYNEHVLAFNEAKKKEQEDTVNITL